MIFSSDKISKLDVGSSKNTETGDVTYMALEAPLYEVGARDAIGADAYKLKLAMCYTFKI